MTVNELIEKLQAMPEQDRALPVLRLDRDWPALEIEEIEIYEATDGHGVVFR